MTDLQDVRFDALELRADGGFDPVTLRCRGAGAEGWDVERNGAPWLRLGPGYRLMETVACGVCSTDLDRIHLPFPLPQVVGHEMVVVDAEGRRFVVEINASPAARGQGVPGCLECSSEMHRHCRERLVVGIHDLPGGFGPRVLAPEHALVPVPDALPTATAVLVEPFAAALRAVERSDLRPGDRVAVLGPRRLGTLLVAALAGTSRQRGHDFSVTAVVRREELVELQRRVGADHVELVQGDHGEPLEGGRFDVVFDTTGSPAGLETALRLARREVHLKSTHGRPAAGLEDPTALVVDELVVGRFDPRAPRPEGRVAWLSREEPPAAWLAGGSLEGGADAASVARASAESRSCLRGAETVVVDRFDEVATAMRPLPNEPFGAVRPTGQILVREVDAARSALGVAVVERGLRLNSSRCGDFTRALELLARDPELRALGAAMIDRRLDARALEAAFAAARSPDVVKVLIEHPRGIGSEA